MRALTPGALVWAAPEAAVGRAQASRRPALVVSGSDYLGTVTTLAIVVPLTTVDRGWLNHVSVHGGTLPQPSWAMTEQIRTISRERIVGCAGFADPATLDDVRDWIRDFLDLQSGARLSRSCGLRHRSDVNQPTAADPSPRRPRRIGRRAILPIPAGQRVTAGSPCASG